MIEKHGQKNNKPLPAHLSGEGLIRCPKCRRALARAYYGAKSKGIEIKCRCGQFVRIEL